MRVLITGGAGYIGSVATRKLIEEGHKVLVYDSLIKGHRKSVNTHFVQGCLSNKELLDQTFKKFNPEAVVHFAGFIEAGESMQNPPKFFGNNVINGLRLLDTMLKNNVKKIIYSSSAAVYAPKNRPLKEEDTRKPANFYGETKLMFEQILQWYDSLYEIKSTSLRYFNATGSMGDLGERHDPETHLVPLVLLAALGKRSQINIFGTDYKTPDKTCIRDYVHVQDLADAHILALQDLDQESKIYNVGTGKGVSVKQVIDAVKKVTKRDFKVVESERRLGDPSILVADSKKIKKELGWRPKIDFLEGLKENADFFQRKIQEE